MSIVTISRGSHSKGKEVAEKVAERLGYGCVSRDLLLEASDQFKTPEFLMIRGIHDSPYVFERFSSGKEKYVAYIRVAILRRLREDNVVYHGLAGHHFVRGIGHVLKVRIIADLKDRIQEEMWKKNASPEQARILIEKNDEARRKWGLHLYGIDVRDARLYDMTLRIRKLRVNEVVDLIVHTLASPRFRTTPESKKKMDDLWLAAEVEAGLVEVFPRAKTEVDGGNVTVSIEGPAEATERITEKARRLLEHLTAVRELRVAVNPTR